eukprot:48197_1
MLINYLYHLLWCITKHQNAVTRINLITLVISIVCFVSLIYCTSISNSIHIIGRGDARSSSNINKLNKHLMLNSTDNIQCKQSTYKFAWNVCCFRQFSYNYLYFAGYRVHDPHLFSLDDSSRTTTMTYHHNDPSHFGCYGLQIWQAANYYTSRIPIFFKTQLMETVIAFCRQKKIEEECRSWLPLTYRFSNPDDKVVFFKQLPCNNEPSTDWILKSDVHGGAGIIFINDSNYFRRKYLTKEQQLQSNPNCVVGERNSKKTGKIVAQQFIANILTINGYKFHIRSFFVLANFHNPYIVLYADSIVIKATKKYSLETFQKSNIITNRAISKNNIHSTNDWVWNMKQLCEYLDIDLHDIINQIKEIAKIIFVSAKLPKNTPTSGADGHVQRYLLTALDLLLTDDFQLKVMELNRAVTSSFIPRMCNDIMETSWQCKMGKMIQEEMIDIEIELAMKQRMGTKIHDLHSLKNFQLIIWE